MISHSYLFSCSAILAEWEHPRHARIPVDGVSQSRLHLDSSHLHGHHYRGRVSVLYRLRQTFGTQHVPVYFHEKCYILIWISVIHVFKDLCINRLVQERCNSSATTLELRLSCTNPSVWCTMHCEMGGTQCLLRYVSALNVMRFMLQLILIVPSCFQSHNASHMILNSLTPRKVEEKYYSNLI